MKGTPSARRVAGPRPHRHRTGISRPVMHIRTRFFGPHLETAEGGQRLVLWMSDSGLVAMDELCAHRASPLSAGKVVRHGERGELCLSCPYHCWKFDTSGRIADVPSENGSGRWPKRVIQKTYRVEYEGPFAETMICLRETPDAVSDDGAEGGEQVSCGTMVDW